MKKMFYPAIFLREETGYSVSFPDLPGCFTQGESLAEACEMASEAIGLYLQQPDGSFDCPVSTALPSPGEGETIVLIEFDELEYRKKHDSRAVKKTLTIPSWLNTEAEQAGINFSQTLQTALKQQLGL